MNVLKWHIVIKTGRESLKIAPPLSISHSALKEGIEIIQNSINRVSMKQ